MDFRSSVVSIDQFISSIKALSSPDPAVLPLRKSGEYPGWVTNAPLRRLNARLYSTLKSRFLGTGLAPRSEPGLYFFFRNEATRPIFYYIGVADSIKRRLGEHLTRLDYIFYSIAHPARADSYFNEVMAFYGEGLYPNHKDEYLRQFLCYKSTGFQSIAWLSSPTVAYFDWKEVETFYVSIFKPCVNVDKKDATPDERFRGMYQNSLAHLFSHVMHEPPQNGRA
jgi:hypothetical protein